MEFYLYCLWRCLVTKIKGVWYYLMSFQSLRWGRERDCGQRGDGGDCQQHVHIPGGRHGQYHSILNMSIVLLMNDLIPWIILQETAIERANDVFEKLDVNDDGSLDEQEFVDGCMNDERLAQLLNTGSGQQHINLEEELETPEEHGEQCWWWKFKYIFSGLLIVLFLANLYQSVPIETWYVVYLFFFIYHFYHILYHGW